MTFGLVHRIIANYIQTVTNMQFSIKTDKRLNLIEFQDKQSREREWERQVVMGIHNKAAFFLTFLRAKFIVNRFICVHSIEIL